MNATDREPIIKRLDRARPTLLSRLRDHPSSDGIPDNLKNAARVYLLLNPDDEEVRQAHNRLRDSRSDRSKQT